jgi:predicted DNA-binding transcriptional regulator YafY
VYRVSRIGGLTTTGATFERPSDFDLPTFWQSYQRRYEAQLYRLDAVVRLSPRARELLFLLGPTVVATVARTAGPPDADGWVTATVPVESIEHAVGEIGRLGAEVEVLEPAELRQRMTRTAATLAEFYLGR